MYQKVQDNDTFQQMSFNLQYLYNASERTYHNTPPSLLNLLIRNFSPGFLFSTYELTGDHKFRERRYINTYKLNICKLNN